MQMPPNADTPNHYLSLSSSGTLLLICIVLIQNSAVIWMGGDSSSFLMLYQCGTHLLLISFPFSPVGPDWRNVSSCKRWLPYCGICPVEGRLALLLGQSESPHPPFWPPRGTQLEGWWGDARYDLPPPSLPFTVTEYLYLMSLAFPMLKEWPCCLDDGRVTGFGTLDSLYRSWQAVNALHMCVFMVLFHGGWRFCSLSAPKQ